MAQTKQSGSKPCANGCGNTISANKLLCSYCMKIAEKAIENQRRAAEIGGGYETNMPQSYL